ncbi:peptidylprolyl isomerase [Compostibacter hankyongensis]|uniref:peptidylprolyl isomerase n=1 Tax=Compostibacter hankyongensis TaxID=1007089 RepID=A0ABP8G5C5_9BACT
MTLNPLKQVALLTLMLCGLAPLRAQTVAYSGANKPVADQVVAAVGNKIVLESELENQLSQARQQQVQLPPDAKCFFLQQMLANKALVLQAERDSLPVTDDEVNAQLEQRLRYFIGQYGSQEKMEEVTGRSVYQIRDEFREPIREGLLAQAMQSKIFEGVKITPSEVKDYFDKIPKDSLLFYESEVEVGQIVLNPKPSPSVVQYTIDQLNDLKKQAESGQKSFEVLATIYSKDVATGGNVLTVDRTQHNFDPDFVAAAFRLKNGEISSVTKTQFGYHIIQMVSRQGDIAKVRHILLIPPITQIDLDRTIKKLDSLRTDIVEGKTTFGVAAAKNSDDDNVMTGTKRSGGMFTAQDGSTYLPIDQLDKGIVLMLDTLKVGEISAPVTFTPDPRMQNSSVRIVYLKSRSEPHRENLQDDYSKIQDRALQEKQYKALMKWYDEHMPSFYLRVDPQYADCPSIGDWVKKSQSAKD